jgi:hypothetical protein
MKRLALVLVLAVAALAGSGCEAKEQEPLVEPLADDAARASSAGNAAAGSPSAARSPAATAEETSATPVAGFDPGDKFPDIEDGMWNLVKKMLAKYPMNLKRPEEKSLCVRVADKPVDLFSSSGWASADPDAKMYRGMDKLPCLAQNRLAVVHKQRGYRAEMWMCLCRDNFEAMRRAIRGSAWLMSCARGSTWHGFEPIPVQEASFVANLSKGPSNDVVWSIGNIRVLLAITKDAADSLARQPPTTTWWGQPTHFLDEAELGRLASQLSIVVAVSAPEAKPAEPNQLKVTIGEMIENSVSISVETPEDGGLKGWWIRMDTIAGRLTLEAPGRAALTDVPEGGATVKCYAVSPDGKKWYFSSVRVEGQE